MDMSSPPFLPFLCLLLLPLLFYIALSPLTLYLIPLHSYISYHKFSKQSYFILLPCAATQN